jgi:hypothetical protein
LLTESVLLRPARNPDNRSRSAVEFGGNAGAGNLKRSSSMTTDSLARHGHRRIRSVDLWKEDLAPSGDQTRRSLAPALPGTSTLAPSDTLASSTTPCVRGPEVPGAGSKTTATRDPSGETSNEVATSPLGPFRTGPGTPSAPSMCTTFRSDHTTLFRFTAGSTSEYSCAPKIARTVDVPSSGVVPGGPPL